jgi:hypothetical protein
MKIKVALGFMCAVDFAYELGEALGGTSIYESSEDLRNCRACIDECGEAEVATISKADFIHLIQMAKFDPADLITSAVGEIIWTKPSEPKSGDIDGN